MFGNKKAVNLLKEQVYQLRLDLDHVGREVNHLHTKSNIRAKTLVKLEEDTVLKIGENDYPVNEILKTLLDKLGFACVIVPAKSRELEIRNKEFIKSE